MTDVSVVGTGLMGSAIVRSLLRSGRSVTVWNRSPEKAATLAAEGAQTAKTASEAIHSSPVTIFVIFSYDTVVEILESAIGSGPVGSIINLVTGSPAEALQIGTWAKDRGVSLLDGVLLTYPKGIGGKETLVVFSGDIDVWKRHEDLLRTIAGRATYLGEAPQLANSIDHVSLSFVTICQTAIFATLAYAQSLDVPTSTAVQHIKRSLANFERYIDYASPMIEQGNFETSEATINTWVRSSRDFAIGWNEVGLPGRLINAAADTIKAAQDAGFGEMDIAAIYKYELLHRKTESQVHVTP